jgi:hypothetical protein
MNAERNKDDIKSTAIKKKHRVISLEDKLHMINKYEAGSRTENTVRAYVMFSWESSPPALHLFSWHIVTSALFWSNISVCR